MTAAATTSLLGLDPAAYQPHALHAGDRVWTETNCYVDVWVEVLHALGRDPVPAAACAYSADFLGDQWQFLKFAPEDLRALYSVAVDEMNVWRPLLDHVEEQLAAGRLLTIEADSWYLPDTAGVAYGLAHQKSTIVPEFVDREARTLRYFHNAGYWELAGADFDGVFRVGADPASLSPYVELVRLGDPSADLTARAVEVARRHVRQRPAGNPVARLGDRLRADLPWLAASDLDTFHHYAFGTVRQCGFTAELAGTVAGWLTEHGAGDLSGAVTDFRIVAEQAKSVQFRLARLARGRSVEVAESLEEMARCWQRAMVAMSAWAG